MIKEGTEMALNIKPFYPFDHPAQTSAMLAMWARQLESQCSIGTANLKGQHWEASYEDFDSLRPSKSDEEEEEEENIIDWEEEKEVLMKQLDCC